MPDYIVRISVCLPGGRLQGLRQASAAGRSSLDNGGWGQSRRLGVGRHSVASGHYMQWGEEVYGFNLEMVLDVASGAVVGMAVSDFEDEAVLLDAFADAVGNTGSAPYALSLDNRASNHTERVSEAIKAADSEILATTLGRGQSKAPLEGTFGLFNQDLPKRLYS